MKSWLHRRLWRRLPQRWRRRALFGAASLLAPRPDSDAPALVEPVYVAGVLSTASGLGQSARLGLGALQAAGIAVRPIDLSAALMQDGRLPNLAVSAPGPRDDGEGPGTIILHVSGFLMALAMLRLGRRCVCGKRIIGYWAWELPDLTPEWFQGFRYVHEIWVPSRFTAAAVARHTNLPVRVVPHPVPPAATVSRAADADGRGPLVVLVAFDMRSGFVRKNPLAAISAFRAAFGTDTAARLIVKVAQPEAYPPGWQALRAAVAGAGNIALDDRLLDAAGMAALLDGADIVLSLHRAEGFGLVLAEAMRRGAAIVATDWSGNTDFLTAANSCPVAYRLVPAVDPQGGYDAPDQLWAEPDIGDAARQLRRLADAELRRRLGAQAQQDAGRAFAPELYAEALAGTRSLYRGAGVPSETAAIAGRP